jgi:hypothetical protein
MTVEERMKAGMKELNDQIGEWGNAILSYDGQGAAIVGAAYVEQRLESLLRAVFVEVKLGNALLEDARTLGSFSAKIDLAKAIGLIDLETASRLHCIRKVRNEAAHSDHGYKLETEQDLSRVSAFVYGDRADRIVKRSVRVRYFVLCIEQVAVLTARRILVEMLVSDGFATTPGRVLPEMSRGSGEDVVSQLYRWFEEIASEAPEPPVS